MATNNRINEENRRRIITIDQFDSKYNSRSFNARDSIHSGDRVFPKTSTDKRSGALIQDRRLL